MAYNYPIDEIKKKVAVCLGIFFKNDSFLLQNDTNERTIAHKLAEYLQTEFPDWNVDCEYNRKGFNIKTLENIHECSEQRKTDRVYPDIIVHRRNKNDNLLVIEIKVNADDYCDIEKLKKFTSSSEKYKYQSGLFIRFNSKNEKPSLRWFINGQEQ
jgi:isocitrate dehydrogenase